MSRLAPFANWAHALIRPCLALSAAAFVVQAVIYARTGCIAGSPQELALQITPAFAFVYYGLAALLINAIGDWVVVMSRGRDAHSPAVQAVLDKPWAHRRGVHRPRPAVPGGGSGSRLVTLGAILLLAWLSAGMLTDALGRPELFPG